MSAYQPKTGAKCGCRRGVQRDNCPHCEGTGMVIDFEAILARRDEDMNIQPKIAGATHTPGPWAVEPRQWDHGASLAIVAPHNGHIVAIVPFDEDIQIVDEPDGDTVRRHPDELPNAAMLAAAPAMYEALQHALGVCEGEAELRGDSDSDDYLGGAAGPVAQMIRHALAQAERRQ